MWKVQPGERAPFWCTLLVFTQSGGKWFMPPVVVHQAKEYSKDLHHNIPLDWTVHHTPSDYMDRDRWLNSTTQFTNICIASPVSNQIIFFDGHNSHSDDRTLTQIQSKNIQTFIIKVVDSINNHPMTMGLTQNCSLSRRISG